MAELFGFEIARKKPGKSNPELKSFVAPEEDEGAHIIQNSGGHFAQYIDIDGDRAKDVTGLIMKYRATAAIPECDAAVEDIINEALIMKTGASAVSLDMSETDISDSIREKIKDEFNHVVKLLKIQTRGHELFRKWYVDGRLYHHIIVDNSAPGKGILEVRNVDPINIRKVKEIIKDDDTEVNKSVKEYYLYQPSSASNAATNNALKIAPDAISYVTSGIMDPQRKKVLSYIHKALKPANQLKLMEDSLVVYRVSRAPERRVFYIDVGNLPKAKAESYLQGIMNKYRNKMVYDASTGEVRDAKKHMSALEDFWLPRREGGRGTEISSLSGATNLGEIDDIIYFQKKLYRSLNVPVQRLEQEAQFSVGRSTEITRDEIKFSKFVDKLRIKFSELFFGLLRTQLLLKKIISADDWEDVRDGIKIDYVSNVHFTELKHAELIRERVETLTVVDEYVGKYYSQEWIRKNILMQSEDEIKSIDDQIKAEMKDGTIDDSVLDADGDGDFDTDDL